MGKKMIILLVFMLLSNIQIFSQDLYTKKMEWTNRDTIDILAFQNIDKILEWGKSFGVFVYVQSDRFCIRGSNVFILMVEVGSGIPCMYFYVFKEKGDKWELITTSKARSLEPIKVRVDNKKGKMIFELPSGQIGELCFKTLLQSDCLKKLAKEKNCCFVQRKSTKEIFNS